MKKPLYLIGHFAVFLLLMSISCSKDKHIEEDEPIESSGILMIQDQKIELETALLLNRGQENGFYRFGILFYSEYFIEDLRDWINETLCNKTQSHCVYLEIYTTNPNGPIPGTYTFSYSEKKEWAINDNSCMQEIRTFINEGDDFVIEHISGSLDWGELTITDNGAYYNIVFNTSYNPEKPISIHYKGVLIETALDEIIKEIGGYPKRSEAASLRDF